MAWAATTKLPGLTHTTHVHVHVYDGYMKALYATHANWLRQEGGGKKHAAFVKGY